MNFKGNSLKIYLVMAVFSCAFIGHRDCPEIIQEELYKRIENLVVNNGVNRFYVGTQGKFDYLVYKSLVNLKNKYNIEILVVLAYLDDKKKYYNPHFTIFPEALETTPKRYAIIKRNKLMIDKSQFLICYVNNSLTKAYDFLEYAERKGLEIINLGEYEKAD